MVCLMYSFKFFKFYSHLVLRIKLNNCKLNFNIKFNKVSEWHKHSINDYQFVTEINLKRDKVRSVSGSGSRTPQVTTNLIFRNLIELVIFNLTMT